MSSDAASPAPPPAGTSQFQRLLPGLKPGFVLVDGRSKSELLLLSARLSRLFRFFNLENEPEGSWDRFFASDLRIQLLRIALADGGLQQARSGLARLEVHLDTENEAEVSADVLVQLFEGLSTIHRWQVWLTTVGGSTPRLLTLIEEAISGPLASALGILQTQKKRLLERHPSVREAIDSVDLSIFDAGSWNQPQSDEEPEDATSLSTLLGALHTVLDFEERAVESARAELKQLESVPPQHTPNQALFIAFLELFQYAQRDLDGLSPKLLDFYYRTVLRLEPRPASPDEVAVSLEPTSRAETPFSFATGTGLSAGKGPAGQPIRFELVDDLVVTGASIETLETLYNQDGKLYSQSHSPQAKKPWCPFVTPTTSPDHPAKKQALGFALASPMLDLADGARSVTILIPAAPSSAPSQAIDAAPEPPQIDIAMSVGRQHFSDVPASSVTVKLDSEMLTLEIELPPSFAPVCAFSKTPQEPFTTHWPLVRVLFPKMDKSSRDLLGRLRPGDASFYTKVEGLQELALRTPAGTVPPGTRVQPFGVPPLAGAEFLVGSAEAFRKPLESLRLHLEWLGLPASFSTYYRSYVDQDHAEVVFDDDSFTATVSYLSQGEWTPLDSYTCPQAPPGSMSSICDPPTHLDNVIELFVASGSEAALPNDQAEASDRLDPIPASSTEKITNPISVVSAQSALKNQAPDIHLKAPLRWTPETPTGFVRLTLNPSSVTLENPPSGEIQAAQLEKPFGDALYASSLSQVLLRNAEKIFKGQSGSSSRIGRVLALLRSAGGRFTRLFQNAPKDAGAVSPVQPTEPELTAPPNPPYHPLLKSVALDYTATTGRPGLEGYPPPQVFALGAQGVEQIPAVVSGSASTLPLGLFPPGGNLSIGLKGAEPIESLSFLFHLEPLGATLPATSPRWFYRSGRQWQPLEDHDLDDHTAGLLQSGILRVDLPSDATVDPASNLIWLRAQAHSEDLHLYPRVVGIQLNAGRAARVLAAGDPGPGKPLAPDRLTKLVKADPAIAKVSQPLPSAGGRPAEDSSQFHARVSERLRHKGRAVTAWDYERLVLDHFPEIYWVRCLPARRRVTLVVLPLVRTANPAAPYPPRVLPETLDAIRSTLEKLASPFVELEVQNPVFQAVQVTASVRFTPEKPATGLLARLQSDFERWIIPWAAPSTRGPAPPERFTVAQIHTFLNGLSYVSAVSDVSARLELEASPSPDVPDQPVLVPSQPGHLLIAANHNLFTVLNSRDAG